MRRPTVEPRCRRRGGGVRRAERCSGEMWTVSKRHGRCVARDGSRMMSAMKASEVAIGGETGDVFARYRRPRLCVSVQRGETRLENLREVAAALARGMGVPADAVAEGILKQLGADLGVRACVKRTQHAARPIHVSGPEAAGGAVGDGLDGKRSPADASAADRQYVVAGTRTSADLERLLTRLEQDIACCAVCGAAENRLALDDGSSADVREGKRKKKAVDELEATCAACGARSRPSEKSNVAKFVAAVADRLSRETHRVHTPGMR